MGESGDMVEECRRHGGGVCRRHGGGVKGKKVVQGDISGIHKSIAYKRHTCEVELGMIHTEANLEQ